MTRVAPPEWARPHARHATNTLGTLGILAEATIARLLGPIHEELDRRINAFANDPGQCFQEMEDFPQQGRLDGRYYIASETYEGNPEDDFFRLWVMVHCAEKPRHPSQEIEGYDYLGLEAIVTVDRAGTTFEFDDGFNTSCI